MAHCVKSSLQTYSGIYCMATNLHFHYICQAWALGDIAKANGFSINTNSDFLLCFIDYGSAILNIGMGGYD